MATRSITDRILAYNEGRHPRLLKRKLEVMRADRFAFLRGTCHLFYDDWPHDTPLNAAPAVWSCGDLHLENLGGFKGDNRAVYFDINDFDEAILAPCTWDVSRLVTSILVGARELKLSQADAQRLSDSFLHAYAGELVKGHARALDRAEARGMVRDLLSTLEKRSRPAFLDKRTVCKKGQRRLIVDDVRAMAVPEPARQRIADLFRAWAQTQPNRAFYRLIDVAHRIAGLASLGIERYVLLVNGRGSPDENFLLDLKSAHPSALNPYVKLAQPPWAHQSERIVEIQMRMQATPPALLQSVVLDGKPFVLRELQPTQDRVSLDQSSSKIGRLERVVHTMGRVTAWDHLRSGGRQGSAIADDLIAFGLQAGAWKNDVLAQARDCAAKVEADWRQFRGARERSSGGTVLTRRNAAHRASTE